MKYLVTGATGFVGKVLVERMLSEGHSVVILTRSPSRAKTKLPSAVKAFGWNPDTERAPQVAFDGIDVVVHLAGEGVAEKRWSPVQKRKIMDSRVLGTRNLVETMISLPKKPSVFVSASATGIYGDRGDERLTESSAPGTGFLVDVCKGWEEEAQRAESAGIRRVSIRIGIVLEQGGGALKPMMPLFKFGLGGPIGNGKQGMSWIHRDDLVSLFLFAAKTASVTGPVNGIAPNPVSNTEFTKALGHALNRPAFLPAPAFALRLAMGEMADIVLHSQYVLPAKATGAGFHFKFTSLQDALNDICKKTESAEVIGENFKKTPA